MKKFAIYAFALFASATVLTSCGDDEEATPYVDKTVTYTAVLLGAQTANPPSFLATSTGLTYTSSQADSAKYDASKVNLSFSQVGNPTTGTFISMDARKNFDFPSTRTTAGTVVSYFKLSTITANTFDTDSLAAKYITSMTPSSDKSITVQKGKYYEVVSTQGTTTWKSLVYVSNLTQTAGNTDATVTVNVKSLK